MLSPCFFLGINIQGHLAIIISHRFIPNDVQVLSPHLLSQSIYLNRSEIDLFGGNLLSISFGYVQSMVGCTFSSLISISVSSCFPYFETFAFVDHHQVYLFQVCFAETPQTCFVALIKLFFRYFQSSSKVLPVSFPWINALKTLEISI